MLRSSQWISGIEFFDLHENENQDLYLELECLLEIKLTDVFKEFYNKYIPINIFDNQYYTTEVLFESSNSIIRTSQFKDLRLGEVYSIFGILDRINNDDGEINPFIELKMIPIAEGASYNGGILMDQKGVIYYTMDFHEFIYQDEKSINIIATEINELVSKFMIIPFGEMEV